MTPLAALLVTTLLAADWEPPVAVAAVASVTEDSRASDWSSDPAWDRGPAEWAVYAATRVIYEQPRLFEATIFTNTEHLDPRTGVKVDDPTRRNSVAAFKHTRSAIVPAGNYAYRFLTSGHVRVNDLAPMALSMSSQEDCGATFRRFLRDDTTMRVEDHCYFPNTGHRSAQWQLSAEVRFHDLLSLTLRDYPFPAANAESPAVHRIQLVADQTTNHAPPLTPAPATVEYGGRARIDVPFGTVDTHHLIVRHAEMGGATESHYWMAAEPTLLHVMVRYEGPYGVRMELKTLGWWAYWTDERPIPVTLDG